MEYKTKEGNKKMIKRSLDVFDLMLQNNHFRHIINKVLVPIDNSLGRSGSPEASGEPASYFYK